MGYARLLWRMTYCPGLCWPHDRSTSYKLFTVCIWLYNLATPQISSIFCLLPGQEVLHTMRRETVGKELAPLVWNPDSLGILLSQRSFLFKRPWRALGRVYSLRVTAEGGFLYYLYSFISRRYIQPSFLWKKKRVPWDLLAKTLKMNRPKTKTKSSTK